MSLLSFLFGGSNRRTSNYGRGNRHSHNDDDYVSKEDYDEAQRRFREMYEAQQSGDDEKAQGIWDDMMKNK